MRPQQQHHLPHVPSALKGQGVSQSTVVQPLSQFRYGSSGNTFQIDGGQPFSHHGRAARGIHQPCTPQVRWHSRLHSYGLFLTCAPPPSPPYFPSHAFFHPRSLHLCAASFCLRPVFFRELLSPIRSFFFLCCAFFPPVSFTHFLKPHRNHAFNRINNQLAGDSGIHFIDNCFANPRNSIHQQESLFAAKSRRLLCGDRIFKCARWIGADCV